MKKYIIYVLYTNIIVSALIPSIYGATAREAINAKMQQIKLKLRSYKQDVNELSNCLFKKTCSPEEQQALRKKIAIGAAVTGAAAVGLGATIAGAVAISRRRQAGDDSDSDDESETSTTTTTQETTTQPEIIPTETSVSRPAGSRQSDVPLSPRTQFVLKNAPNALFRAVLTKDANLVKNILEQVRKYDASMIGQLSETYATPYGQITLLTYATIAHDKPTVRALLKGGIIPNIDEKAINDNVTNQNNPTYLEIRALIDKAQEGEKVE